MEWEGSLALVLGFSFDLFPVSADLFSPRLNDEAGGKGLPRGESVGESVPKGVCRDGFQGGDPSVEEQIPFDGIRGNFLPQGQERLRDQDLDHPASLRGEGTVVALSDPVPRRSR